MSVKHALKQHFIPHQGNNYHPHILHTKRAVLYGGLCLAMKVFVIAFAAMLPVEAFLAPDVLDAQATKILAMTNEIRKEQGVSLLERNAVLTSSASMKADDMNVNQYFSHTSPQGHGLSYFLAKAGYSYATAGENLAMGFSDAESVVDAWVKSPKHYSNLIDTDFKQYGVGLIAGEYEGKPTVFVAEHFGAPKEEARGEGRGPSAMQAEPAKALRAGASGQTVTVAVNATTSTPTKPKEQAPAAVQLVKKPEPAVAPVKKSVIPSVPTSTGAISTPSSVIPSTVATTSGRNAVETIPSDASSSLAIVQEPVPPSTEPTYSGFVAWNDAANHRTLLKAEVTMTGSVKTATIDANGYPISLKQDQDGVYRGEFTAPASSKDLFKVIIPPTIHIEWQDGSVTDDVVAWKDPKIISQTPWERYMQANSWLSASIPVFPVVKGIYWFALIFFACALALNIFIEIKKQHHFVILQTVGLLAIIAVMIWK